MPVCLPRRSAHSLQNKTPDSLSPEIKVKLDGQKVLCLENPAGYLL